MNERSTEVLNNYASRVFNDGAMRRYLPGDTYKKLKKVIDQGRPMEDPALADIVANGLKRWATSPTGSSPSPAPPPRSTRASSTPSPTAPS